MERLRLSLRKATAVHASNSDTPKLELKMWGGGQGVGTKMKMRGNRKGVTGTKKHLNLRAGGGRME
jgi:hypothetical protein